MCRLSKVTPTSGSTGYLFDISQDVRAEARIDRQFAAPGLCLGTSAFTAGLVRSRTVNESIATGTGVGF
jgi:hypothetical protein